VVPDKPSIVGYKMRFAPMVFFHPIRLGSGKSHCKKIVSLLARFCEGPFLAEPGRSQGSVYAVFASSETKRFCQALKTLKFQFCENPA
jgi:hypothetical protein